MKRIILIFVIIFSLFGVKVANAQTDKSSQNSVVELTKKVDSLQQNLTYLNICIELQELNTFIEQLSNLITDDIYDINILIQINKYDKDDYNTSKQKYEEFDKNAQKLNELINIKELLVKEMSKSLTNNLYKDTINTKLDNIDYSYDALKAHLKAYNEILTIAKKIL